VASGPRRQLLLSAPSDQRLESKQNDRTTDRRNVPVRRPSKRADASSEAHPPEPVAELRARLVDEHDDCNARSLRPSPAAIMTDADPHPHPRDLPPAERGAFLNMPKDAAGGGDRRGRFPPPLRRALPCGRAL
jgi:hypothetical protein